MGGLKGKEELGLDDIVNINFDEVFEFFAVRPLQYIKTTNIWWLDKIKKVYKKVKNDNVLFFIEFFKLSRQIILVAIQNDYPISVFSPYEDIFVEILDLF